MDELAGNFLRMRQSLFYFSGAGKVCLAVGGDSSLATLTMTSEF